MLRRARSMVFGVLAGILLCLATAIPADAAFPGENGRIAFSGWDPGGANKSDIHTINPDGAGLADLMDAPGYDREPAWSPDGRKIAFALQVEPYPAPGAGFWNRTQIYTMNADGSGLTRVSENAPGDSDIDPAWSPDGQKIAFVRRPPCCGFDIHIVNADGTGQTQVSPGENPAWSPDGSLIAYDTGSTIFTMRPDGTDHRFLVVGTEANWAPDGQRIAFVRWGEGFEEDPCASDLFVVDADGTGETQLTGLPDPCVTLNFIMNPAWSPDGRRIAFYNGSIHTIAADGSDQHAVVDYPGVAQYGEPDWQPLPAPDVKNASKACKALRDSIGDEAFAGRYRNHGQCVRARAH